MLRRTARKTNQGLAQHAGADALGARPVHVDIYQTGICSQAQTFEIVNVWIRQAYAQCRHWFSSASKRIVPKIVIRCIVLKQSIERLGFVFRGKRDNLTPLAFGGSSLPWPPQCRLCLLDLLQTFAIGNTFGGFSIQRCSY